jgi:hypothetical protein
LKCRLHQGLRVGKIDLDTRALRERFVGVYLAALVVGHGLGHRLALPPGLTKRPCASPRLPRVERLTGMQAGMERHSPRSASEYTLLGENFTRRVN